MKNLFDTTMFAQDAEQSEVLLEEVGVRLERIVSFGHHTPIGGWYDQRQVEWVTLLKGEATIVYKDGSQIRMNAGDQLTIPPHLQHRVESVSQDAIWLALKYR